jgi:hypothetical protein
MKRAIFAVLATCSLIAVAAEPQKPAAPPDSDHAAQPQLVLPPGSKILPNGSVQLPDGKVVPRDKVHVLAFRAPGSTCYFIRMLGPAATVKPTSPWIPLQSQRVQAKVTDLVHRSDCTFGGELIPVPVKRLRPHTDADAPGPALTPAVNR